MQYGGPPGPDPFAKLRARHGALIKLASKAQKQTLGAGTHPAIADAAQDAQDLMKLPNKKKKLKVVAGARVNNDPDGDGDNDSGESY